MKECPRCRAQLKRPIHSYCEIRDGGLVGEKFFAACPYCRTYTPLLDSKEQAINSWKSEKWDLSSRCERCHDRVAFVVKTLLNEAPSWYKSIELIDWELCWWCFQLPSDLFSLLPMQVANMTPLKLARDAVLEEKSLSTTEQLEAMINAIGCHAMDLEKWLGETSEELKGIQKK